MKFRRFPGCAPALCLSLGLFASQMSVASEDAGGKDYESIYQRSCFACHSTGAAGAPRTNDAAAWKARLKEKGMDGLVAAARDGSGGMPPGGLCGDCNDEDLRALIEYMSK